MAVVDRAGVNDIGAETGAKLSTAGVNESSWAEEQGDVVHGIQ